MRRETEATTKREAGRRRRFTPEFKRQVVEETLAGEAVPVVASKSISTGTSPRRLRPRGAIEIELNGARIHLKGAADAEALLTR